MCWVKEMKVSDKWIAFGLQEMKANLGYRDGPAQATQAISLEQSMANVKQVPSRQESWRRWAAMCQWLLQEPFKTIRALRRLRR